MPIEDFKGLREKLLENKHWPIHYMFKFIVPNKDGKVEQITSLLPADGELSFKHTKNLKFVSVTCVAYMDSADEIVHILHKASLIEDVLSL